MKNLLEQSVDDKFSKLKVKKPSVSDGKDKFSKLKVKKPSVSDGKDKFSKLKDKKPSTDNTTIPSPQTDKVDQTSTVNLTPRTDPSYKIWLQFSEGDFETTHEKENDVFVFVKAIEKAYFSKNTKQDVY